jgi:hypothetical protein
MQAKSPHPDRHPELVSGSVFLTRPNHTVIATPTAVGRSNLNPRHPELVSGSVFLTPTPAISSLRDAPSFVEAISAAVGCDARVC